MSNEPQGDTLRIGKDLFVLTNGYSEDVKHRAAEIERVLSKPHEQTKET